MTPLKHKLLVGSRWSRSISSRTNFKLTRVYGVRVDFQAPVEVVRAVGLKLREAEFTYVIHDTVKRLT